MFLLRTLYHLIILAFVYGCIYSTTMPNAFVRTTKDIVWPWGYGLVVQIIVIEYFANVADSKIVIISPQTVSTYLSIYSY